YRSTAGTSSVEIVKAPYPDCHRKNATPRSCVTRCEDAPFTSPTSRATETDGCSRASICMWSLVPPTAHGGQRSCRLFVAMARITLGSITAEINGRPRDVFQTACTYSSSLFLCLSIASPAAPDEPPKEAWRTSRPRLQPGSPEKNS